MYAQLLKNLFKLMETFKSISEEQYSMLFERDTALDVNGIIDETVLVYAKTTRLDGTKLISKYYTDDNGIQHERLSEFIPGKEY